MAPIFSPISSSVISTRSARGGGDIPDALVECLREEFQPAPPVGAETRPRYRVRGRPWKFQPAPPVGAETQRGTFGQCFCNTISTRSARGGGDFAKGNLLGVGLGISTRSARGGGDRLSRLPAHPKGYFNPLRPWGRRPSILSIPFSRSKFQPAPPVGAETGTMGWR